MPSRQPTDSIDTECTAARRHGPRLDCCLAGEAHAVNFERAVGRLWVVGEWGIRGGGAHLWREKGAREAPMPAPGHLAQADVGPEEI